MSKFELYVSPGACSRVPMIALEEAGQDFTEHLVRFMRGEHRHPDFLKLNPKGKVPVLLADGLALTENVAIIQFLAAKFPEAGLMPKASSDFEAARQTADLCFCSSTLHPIVTRIRMPMFFAGEANVDTVRSAGMKDMAMHAAAIDSRLAEGDWWYAENWSAVDAYLLWIWFRITGAGFPEADYPNWADHARRMQDRASVKRALEREQRQFAQLESEGASVPLS